MTIEQAIPVLQQTPAVLTTMLQHLPAEWTTCNEGEGTWSVFDIVGHLVHGEQTDWIPRIKIIVSKNGEKTFEPFDRFAQFENSKGKSLENLLVEFERSRRHNVAELISMNITDSKLEQTAIHPALGTVTLSQLIATWVVHDLNHISQICRVMSARYTNDVGPWKEYLRILN